MPSHPFCHYDNKLISNMLAHPFFVVFTRLISNMPAHLFYHCLHKTDFKHAGTSFFYGTRKGFLLILS